MYMGIEPLYGAVITLAQAAPDAAAGSAELCLPWPAVVAIGVAMSAMAAYIKLQANELTRIRDKSEARLEAEIQSLRELAKERRDERSAG